MLTLVRLFLKQNSFPLGVQPPESITACIFYQKHSSVPTSLPFQSSPGRRRGHGYTLPVQKQAPRETAGFIFLASRKRVLSFCSFAPCLKTRNTAWERHCLADGLIGKALCAGRAGPVSALPPSPAPSSHAGNRRGRRSSSQTSKRGRGGCLHRSGQPVRPPNWLNWPGCWGWVGSVWHSPAARALRALRWWRCRCVRTPRAHGPAC